MKMNPVRRHPGIVECTTWPWPHLPLRSLLAANEFPDFAIAFEIGTGMLST